MQKVVVTSQILRDSAGECVGTAGQIDGQLASLKSYVINMQAIWQGLPADKFQQLMEDFDRYGKQLHGALEGISQELGKNATMYDNTSETNHQYMTNIQNAIPTAQI